MFLIASTSGATLMDPTTMTTIAILEQGTGLVSDVIGFQPQSQVENGPLNEYVLIFQSDMREGPLSLPSGATTMVEDGTIQDAPFTVHWSDGATDTIRFQSDVEPSVPEPASLLLLAFGLAGLAGTAWGTRSTR